MVFELDGHPYLFEPEYMHEDFLHEQTRMKREEGSRLRKVNQLLQVCEARETGGVPVGAML